MTVDEGRRRDVKEQRAHGARHCRGEPMPRRVWFARGRSFPVCLSILIGVSLFGDFVCKLRAGRGLGVEVARMGRDLWGGWKMVCEVLLLNRTKGVVIML